MIQEVSLSWVQRAQKRALDVAISLPMLLVMLPLLLACAALIKLTSPGPVLYRIRRFAPDGTEVVQFKFRTMRVSSDAMTGPWAISEDPRITAVGLFLRKTALDELPTLFNVLSGQLSLVGPRPKHRLEYESYVNVRRVVVRAKPGITFATRGLSYGATPDMSTIDQLHEAEISYVSHWSLWTDAKIIAKTFLASIRSTNAY